MEVPGYAKRIRTAREEAGKSLKEMASLLDISLASYRDLEWYDDEILTCVSLRQVGTLCEAIGIDSRELLSAGQQSADQVSQRTLQELIRHIRDYMRKEQITLEEFEDKAGWEITPALYDYKKTLE
jgi:DNA-binding XRE family transcriptional regulator